MLSKHIAIVLIYLIMMNGVVMMAKAKKLFENNHCQYKRTSANMKSSKLILNGDKTEINGREYQCSDGTFFQTLKGDTHNFIHGETSDTEHHITKRWFSWLFIPAAIVACAIFCGGESSDEDVNPPPNNPPTLTCPASGTVVYAERSKITARHYWSDPQANDPDGDSLVGPTLTSGSPSGSEFIRGTHTVTYELSDNKGATSTCSFSFSVKVISCQPIQPKANSIMTCDGEFIYGSSCRIKCKEGHEMLPIRSNNEQIITCETDGVSGIHNESPNLCQEISCPGNDPALYPANGYPLCSSSDYTYKTVCSTRCESGYAVLEENQIECQSNKTWSNHLSGCIDIQKPMINDCPKDIFSNAERSSQPSSVSWKEPTAIDNSGKVTIKQIKGQPSGSLFPLGSHKIVYSATDAVGNVSPNCTFNIHITELTCTPPILNDRFLLHQCPNGYVYGSFCELSCMGNFHLVGSDTITCEKNKTGSMATTYWDVGTEEPYCKTNPCNPLPPPRNGAISCAAWIYGQVCTMQCQEKFDIPYGIKIKGGSSNFNGRFICSQTTGEYFPTNVVPNCTEVRKIDYSRLPSEFFYFAGDCNDAETLVQIKENFIKVMEQLEKDGWGGVCPDINQCHVNNTDITCGPITGRRKRSADGAGKMHNIPYNRYRRRTSEIRVSFSVETSWKTFESSNKTFYSMEEIQKRIFHRIKSLAVNGSFNVHGLDPDIDSFSSGFSDPECPKGTARKQNTMKCVPCSVGTFLDKSNPSQPTCRKCPHGSYKDSEDTATCTPCPRDTFTLDDGAESLSECLGKCDIGEFSSNGLMPCNICPRGTYNSVKMSTTCELCPRGKTSNPKSDSVEKCTDFDITFVNKEDAIFLNGSQTLESKNIALFTWIKNDNSNLVLLQGKSSSFDMKITYGETVLVEINGCKLNLNITRDTQNWHHVAIIMSTETNTISVFINGIMDSQKSLPCHRNANLIEPDFRFAVVLDKDPPAEISISGYQITANVPSGDEILRHSSSCSYIMNDTYVTLSNIDWTSFDSSHIKTPSQCDNVNQCIPNPCNGHRCIDLVRNFRCDCNNGFTGETCEVPPDYCSAAPCKNDGVCQNGKYTHICTCSKEYKGKNCEIPVVNGGWSAWGDFSECSVSCNGGIKKRFRVCNNPFPDPEGLQCDSSLSAESLSCNTKACPTCPELQLSFGNVMNCSEISGDKVCSVSCVAGYAFAPENLPLKEYRCGQSTGYIWNGLTPACGKAMIPNKLSSVTAIEYNSSIPCTYSVLAIETLHKNLESTLSCFKHGICELTTSMDECENKKEAGSLKITLNATLPAEDLDLLHYLTTGMLNKGLKLLVNTLVDLENSTKKINDSNEILSFDMGGVKYSPSRKQATGIVVCGVGQGSDGPICIDCPMGTYSTVGKCLQCPKGTYQSEIGQTQCIICPSGLSTKFVGSQDVSKCTEVINATSNSYEQDQGSSTLGVTEAVIIALSLFTVVTVLLIALSVIFRRYRGKRENEKQDYMKKISMLSTGNLPSLPKPKREWGECRSNDYVTMRPKKFSS